MCFYKLLLFVFCLTGVFRAFGSREGENPVGRQGGGDGDGFSQSVVSFSVDVSGPFEVCEGDSVYLEARVVDGRKDMGYVYRWYRVKGGVFGELRDTVELSSVGPGLTIDSVTLSDDSCYYFCRVTDGFGGEVCSRGLDFQVHALLHPEITLSSGDAFSCMGDTVLLQASCPPVESGLKYYWEGMDILSDRREEEVKVAAMQSTEYRLYVRGRSCSDTARFFLSVDTVDVYVGVPHEVLLHKGEKEVSILAVDRRGERLTSAYLSWSCEGKPLSGVWTNPLLLQPDSNMVIRCAYTPGGTLCRGEGFTHVRLLSRGDYIFGGGEEDGFAEGCRLYYPHLARTSDTLINGESLLVESPVGAGRAEVIWKVLYRDGTERAYGPDEAKGGLWIDRVSSSFDSCLIWCEVLSQGEAGCREWSDTMVVRVDGFMALSLSSDTVELCGRDSVALFVHLDNGDLPWSYRYRLPSGEEGLRSGIRFATDTLYVGKEKGTWLFRLAEDPEAAGRWTDSVYVDWEERFFTGLELVGDYHLGMCSETDLYAKCRPVLYPEGEAGRELAAGSGRFVVDSLFLQDGRWQPSGKAGGWHAIRYIYGDGSGRCNSSDELRLYVDTLPGVLSVTSDVLCRGDEGVVEIETSGAVGSLLDLRKEVHSGRGNRYYRWSETVSQHTVSLPLGVPVDGDTCFVICVDRIRDIHGCESDVAVSDTFCSRSRPDISFCVVARSGQYLVGDSLLLMEKGDSVELRWSLLNGRNPWKMNYLFDGVVTSYGVSGRDSSFYVSDEGSYVFWGEDRDCAERNVKTVHVKWQEKGYLRLFVLLEGHTEASEYVPVRVEFRYAGRAGEAASGSGKCSLLLSDTLYVYADGRVRDEKGNEVLEAGAGGEPVKGDSVYVAVFAEGYLGVMARKGILLSREGVLPVTVDLRQEKEVYSSDSLNVHMTPGADGLWRMSVGEGNENGLISVEDENKGVYNRGSCIVVRRNRHRWQEIK